MNAQTEKLVAQNRKLKEESKKAGKSGKDSLRDMAFGAAKAAAGFVSVGAALAIVNSELQTQLRLQNEIAGKAGGIAQAQRALDINLGITGANEKQRKAFVQDLKDINFELKFGSEIGITRGASRILSATKGDRALALETVRQVAPFARGQAGGVGDIGTQVAQLQQAAGITPEQGTRLILALAGQARTEELSQLKVTGRIAAAAAKSFPDAPIQAIEQAFAIFGGVGGEAGEGKGEQTATGTISAITKLAELTGGKGTPLEAAQLLRTSPVEIQREFVKSGFEAGVKVPFQEFLTAEGGGQTGREVRNIVAKFAEATPESLLQAAERQRNLTPEIRAAAATEAVRTAEEKFAATPRGRALLFKATVREKLASALKLSEAPFQGTSLRFFDLLADERPAKLAIEQLERRRGDIAGAARIGGLFGGDAGEPASVGRLDKAIEELRGIRANQQQIRTNAEGDE